MWNYSYSFEQETQLASWEVLGRESNGAFRIACSLKCEAECEKILLWTRKSGATRHPARVLEINGKAIRDVPGFYVGFHTERQGMRVRLRKGRNRIEVLVYPGEEDIADFLMQLIDVPAAVKLKKYRRFWHAPVETFPFEKSDIVDISGMTPGAGHRPFPGRFGFVKGAGLLDCSMHAFGKVSKMYLCGDPRRTVPWAWGYSLIQEEDTDADEWANETYHVSPLCMRWHRSDTKYLCSTAFPGIVTQCGIRPYLKVSYLTFAGN